MPGSCARDLTREATWCCAQGATLLREEEREQVERGELRGEALGGGDGHFFSGPGEEVGVGFAGDGGVDDVGDGERLEAVFLGDALGGGGVGGFAGLGDGDDERAAAIERFAIAVFAGVFDFDGNAGEFLNHELAAKPGVAAGSAGHDGHAMQFGDIFGGKGKAVEADGTGRRVNVLLDGLPDGFGLLIDFLQHKVGELARIAI